MNYFFLLIGFLTVNAKVVKGMHRHVFRGNDITEFDKFSKRKHTVFSVPTIWEQHGNLKSSQNNKAMRDYEPKTDEVVVCLKKGFGTRAAKKIARRHNAFKYVKQLVFGKKKFYVYKINKAVRGTDIDVDLEDSDPDVADLRKDKKVLFVKVQQKNKFAIADVNKYEITGSPFWNFNGEFLPSMKIPQAWNRGYSGKNVKVAIVDQPVQLNHYDLIKNMNYNNLHYDFVNDDPYLHPPDSSSVHGTAVAGVLLSQGGNYKCSVGVAYDATGISLAVIGPKGEFDADDEQLATYLSHDMHYIDIYSNSWGPGRRYGYIRLGEVLQAALETGAQEGRGGYGSIYCFAAGNNFPIDNINANGILTSIYVIAISSVGRNNKTSIYGSVGSPIMAVAYGGDIGSTDVGLVVPFPESRCVQGVAGTSFSCPTASGVIALCLEANPFLSWRSVQHMLARTSKKYTFVDNNPDYQWQENGAGLWTHPTMGFGLLDAEAMVEMAETFTDLPELNKCVITRKKKITSRKSIPESDTIQVNCEGPDVNCEGIKYLESVLVNIDFSYSAFRGSVQIFLYSPYGTKSFLMTERKEDSVYRPYAGSWEWTYKTVQTWGENPCGDEQFEIKPWRLEIGSTNNNVSGRHIKKGRLNTI